MTFLIDPFILFFRSHFYLKASLFAPTITFLPLWIIGRDWWASCWATMGFCAAALLVMSGAISFGF